MARSASKRRAIGPLGFAVSIAVHVLLLAGILLTIKLPHPATSEQAVSVSLFPRLFQGLGRPAPVRRSPETAGRRMPVPQAASPPEVGSPPQTPPGAPPTVVEVPAAPPAAGLPPNLIQALRRSFGCASPDLYKLTAAERDGCAKRDDQLRRDAKPLPLMIPPDKTAAWDAALKERRRPPNAEFAPCEGVGSNLGVGCLPADSGHKIKF